MDVGEYLILFGAFVMFSGALGLGIFSDPFQRFHPPTKVSLFGLAVIIVGDVIAHHAYTGEWSFSGLIACLAILFAGPFAAHVLARALYQAKLHKD